MAAISLHLSVRARTHKHTHTPHNMHSQLKKTADGFGLAALSIYKPAYFTPSHTAQHPPIQAKPAQIHKLKPLSPPNLSHSLPDPTP